MSIHTVLDSLVWLCCMKCETFTILEVSSCQISSSAFLTISLFLFLLLLLLLLLLKVLSSSLNNYASAHCNMSCVFHLVVQTKYRNALSAFWPFIFTLSFSKREEPNMYISCKKPLALDCFCLVGCNT